ncbi:MAG: VIT1/CCC1 transporter family protein [Pseudomonadota bacterium]|nr:VIT1/CCC1 transporter family protein [Pseudomonadota bacterium]
MSLHHHEHHLASSAALRDFVLGMSDGLTVPFALAAGLAGAVDSTGIIVTAGVAEIAAGAISMGLGGYLAARTEKDHYDSEERRERREIEELPHVEAQEVGDILRAFGVPEAQVPAVVDGIRQHPERWIDFMMRFELGLEKPDPRRLVQSPLIIGGAYALGGLIPLTPYVAVQYVPQALCWSIAVSIVALLVFGIFKAHFTGQKLLRSALQTVITGSLAAATAFFLARLVR